MRKVKAFTQIELLLIILVVLVLVSLFPVSFSSGRTKRQRLSCVNNLKIIGTAYRIWSPDQSDLYPAQQRAKLGGWREVLTDSNLGSICWTNYAIMSNELSLDPKLVICPSDDRKPAKNFGARFSNLNISYFVDVSASDAEPASLLSGDRNLAPGSVGKDDFGFSPENGQGNDVAIALDTQANPVCWSLKMHSERDTAGKGNILLGDGSVQQVTSGSLRVNWLPNAGKTNNWRFELGQTSNWPAAGSPSKLSIRVLFP